MLLQTFFTHVTYIWSYQPLAVTDFLLLQLSNMQGIRASRPPEPTRYLFHRSFLYSLFELLHQQDCFLVGSYDMSGKQMSRVFLIDAFANQTFCSVFLGPRSSRWSSAWCCAVASATARCTEATGRLPLKEGRPRVPPLARFSFIISRKSHTYCFDKTT